jgi:hypothetical protein
MTVNSSGIVCIVRTRLMILISEIRACMMF